MTTVSELQPILEMASTHQAIADNLRDVRLHYDRNKGRAHKAAMLLPYQIRTKLPENVRLHLNV